MTWTMKTPAPGGAFEVPPAGLKAGVLVGLIDLGTHDDEFTDPKTNETRTKAVRKVFLVWELTGCKMSGTGNNHTIGRAYTWSLNEKAALRKVVKAWRGKDLREGEDFDILSMLGKAFALTLTHKESGEKVYVNLDGVGALPEEMIAGIAKRKPFARPLDSAEPLPDWLPRIYGEKVEDFLNRSKEMYAKRQTASVNAQAEDAF
jgi:predicted RecA/RadA family phage recombinase